MTVWNAQDRCPDETAWHCYVDSDSTELSSADRADFEEHLGHCEPCAQLVHELELFRTLLLKARVPGMTAEQWEVMDERALLMGSEFVPPSSRLPQVYWGVAIAAASAFLFLGAWQLATGPEHEPGAHAAAKHASTVTRHLPGQVPVDVLHNAPLVAGAVDGELQVVDGQGNWQPMKAGHKLGPKTRIRSTMSSRQARLVVPGHFELEVSSGTEVVLLRTNPKSTFVRLRRGAITCQVEKRRPDQRFAVFAGRFRMAVLGTRFLVRHSDDAQVAVLVAEGAVRVDEATEPLAKVSETTTVVRAGSRWHFAEGRVQFGPISIRPSNGQNPISKVDSATSKRKRQTRAKPSPTQQPASHTDDVGDHEIVIEVPPQGMSSDEVEKLKAVDRNIDKVMGNGPQPAR